MGNDCRRRGVSLSLAWTFVGWAMLWASVILDVSPAFAGSAQYFYDPAGRLTAMLDPVNGTAQYNYDKSGNITSIVRNSLSTITVLQASPSAAPIGGTVTIAGTAFGTTANTTVSFNGTTATPSAVTSTSITVTVPSGATTGMISVTAPSGTASAVVPFAVSSTASPTITSFTTGTGTPTTASVGNTVTITGTNFDTALSKVRINQQLAQITSASATSLAVTVPQAGSGPISVQTPIGSATSSGDLIVAPYGIAPANVTSVRTTIGASLVTVVAGGTSGAALVLFDVTAGQRISPYFKLNGVSGCSTLAVLLPNGNPVLPAQNSCANDYYFGPYVAPTTGTYAMRQTSGSGGGGSGSLQGRIYSVPADPVTPITIGGSAGSVVITTPTQTGSFTFSGTTGQKITIKMDYHLMSTCSTFTLYNPDGSIASGPTHTCANTYYASSPYVLAQTGTYKISEVPDTGGTGTTSATLYSVPADATASATIGGGAASISITTPGQNGSITFSGTTGQKIDVFIDLHSMSGCNTSYKVTNPDTSTLFPQTGTCANGVFVSSAPIVLSQTGTYTISLIPDIGITGSISATLLTVPADATGTVTVNGSATSLSVTVPYQKAIFSFSGTSGQNYTVNMNFSGMTTCSTYSVLNPSSSTLYGPTHTCSNNPSTGSLAVSQTGTFQIVVVPDVGSGLTNGTGTVGAAVTNP